MLLKDQECGELVFELSEDQKLIRDTAREFAEKYIAPKAKEVDAEHRFPRDNWELMAEQGFCGIPLPEEYNGAGMDYVSYSIVIDEISRACATTGVMLSAHISLCCTPIVLFGSEEQKQKFLTPLAEGTKLGAFALSEPCAGSDVSSVRCQARKEGDKYILNGVKNWITNGKEADTYVIIASTNPKAKQRGLSAFIVEKGTPGFSFGKVEDKLGIRGSSTTELIFENCEIPAENLLGKEGLGFKVAMETLDGGRIGIASQAVGILQAAYDAAYKYSYEREAFSRPLNELQAVRFMLLDMNMDLDAARLLIYQACNLHDAGKKFGKESAAAKLFASEAAMRHSVKAVQIFGGYGYTTDYDVERFMRDAKITEIYEGTSEVQRLVISNSALRG
jgi:butyryl-CoA dehydrogenase